MPRKPDPLEMMRSICLSLPETKETPTWGQPHFRVREKIFAGCGSEKGLTTIGFKLERAHAEAIIERPGFSRAPYVGHAGWVSLDALSVKDWDEVRDLVHESYRLIAPKGCQAKMSAGTKEPKPAARTTRAKSATRRSPAAKPAGPKAKSATRRSPAAKPARSKR